MPYVNLGVVYSEIYDSSVPPVFLSRRRYNTLGFGYRG